MMVYERAIEAVSWSDRLRSSRIRCTRPSGERLGMYPTPMSSIVAMRPPRRRAIFNCLPIVLPNSESNYEHPTATMAMASLPAMRGAEKSCASKDNYCLVPIGYCEIFEGLTTRLLLIQPRHRVGKVTGQGPRDRG
jgi:hypothetical protein